MWFLSKLLLDPLSTAAIVQRFFQRRSAASAKGMIAARLFCQWIIQTYTKMQIKALSSIIFSGFLSCYFELRST